MKIRYQIYKNGEFKEVKFSSYCKIKEAFKITEQIYTKNIDKKHLPNHQLVVTYTLFLF